MNIYVDNAATTKMDQEAFEAMKPYLLEEFGNPSQPYFFAKKPKMAVQEARKTIAECIGAEPEEIFFTSGGTESDNWAIKCFGSPSDVKTIITSSIEHHAILNACKTQERTHTVVYLPVNRQGEVNPDDLERALDSRGKPVCSPMARLVSVMLANNEIGTIQPIKELAEIAHRHGAFFHTDAVQAIGHIPVDVKALGVDMLSASAHKFNGPKGVGFLYIKKGTLIAPYNDGGAQEYGMRAGTENVAGIVGMAVALKNNCENLERNRQHIQGLEDFLMERLRQSGLDFVRNGSDNHLPGCISLSFKGQDGEAILHRMDLMGIAISTGSACDSVNTQVSHVIHAIQLNEQYAKGTIRITFGKYSSTNEIDAIMKAFGKILQ